MELVPSSDEEVRKVKVESEGHVSLHSVVNLRKIEGDDELSTGTGSDLGDDDPVNGALASSDDSLPPRNGPPKRAAALHAQQQWLGQFLLSVD